MSPPPPPDDIFDDGPPKRHAKAVNKAADAYDNLKSAKTDAADVAAPDLAALKNFEDMADAQGSLADHIKQSTQEIIKQAKEIGSLRSQIDDVTGAVTGFGRELKKTASITHQYSLAMKEFKQGSEAYTQSLALSTDKLGKASAETTKFMKATQHAYNEAYNVAKIYGLEVDQVRQQMNKLQTTFASQLSATDNQGKALVRLTKEAMMFARTAGVDTSEAIQRMNERLQGSNLTLEEVRVEQMLVMKEMDNYKKKIQDLGKEAMKTGNITSKDLVKALQAVRQEFKLGAYDAGAFAKSFTTMTLKGKKLGLTPEQLKNNVTALGKVMSGLASPETFTGMKTGLAMLERSGEFTGEMGTFMQDLKKRLDEGKIDSIRAAKMALERTKGSPEAMAMQTDIITAAMPENVRAHRLEQLGISSMSADMVNQMMQSGELKEIFKKAKGRTKQERAKEAEAFATPMDKLVKQAHTAQSTRHKMAKTVFDFKQTVTKWIEKYWYMMALIQAGGSLLGRGGAGAAGGLMGGGGAAGMAGGALTVIGAAATIKGLHSAYTRYASGKTTGWEAAGETAMAPLIGGYQLGTAGQKAIGAEIAKGMSLQERTTLGKDTGLDNILGTMAMDNKWIRKAVTSNVFAKGAMLATGTTPESIEKGIDKRGWEMIKKERIGMDWKDFNAAKDLYKLKEKEIKALEKKEEREHFLSQSEKKLLEKKRDEIRLMEKKIAGLKRAIDEEKNVGKQAKKLAKKDITEAFMRMGGVDTEKIETTEDIQTIMNKVLKTSVRIRKGGRGAMEDLAKTGGIEGVSIRKLMRRAGELGYSKEEFGEMWQQQSRYVQAQLGGARLREDQQLNAPVSANEEQLRKLEAKGQRYELNISVSGDEEGGSGVETASFKPDGSYVKETTTKVGLKTKIMVSGDTAKKKAFHSKKLRMAQQGNKQAR
jgi:hypothetical protein